MGNKNIPSIQELDINKAFFSEDNKNKELEPSTREVLLNKMITEVFSIQDIEVKTDLNQKQIDVLSKALLFAEVYDNTTIKTLCVNIMKLSLSKNRKSRGEFVDMSQNTMNRAGDDLNLGGGGLSGRLFG